MVQNLNGVPTVRHVPFPQCQFFSDLKVVVIKVFTSIEKLVVIPLSSNRQSCLFMVNSGAILTIVFYKTHPFSWNVFLIERVVSGNNLILQHIVDSFSIDIILKFLVFKSSLLWQGPSGISLVTFNPPSIEYTNVSFRSLPLFSACSRSLQRSGWRIQPYINAPHHIWQVQYRSSQEYYFSENSGIWDISKILFIRSCPPPSFGCAFPA